MSKQLQIKLENNQFIFDYRKVIFWQEQKILLLTDTHFGKSDAFRSQGISIPSGATNHDLEILSALIADYSINSLYFLGDLIHNKSSDTENLIKQFRKFRDNHLGFKFNLIIGNHDEKANKLIEKLGLDEIRTKIIIDEFQLIHEPPESPELFTFCGHIHPGISINDGFGKVKLPCFHLGKKFCVLPAFGSLTGKAKIKPKKDDRAICIAEGELIEIEI